MTTSEHEELMKKQRSKQIQLIGQLKEQLEDLERFAYLVSTFLVLSAISA